MSDSLPTNATPGSEEKIGVLADRYANGQPFWHPDDSGYDSDYQPVTQ